MIRTGYPTQNLSIPVSTNRMLCLTNLSNTGKVRGIARQNIAEMREALKLTLPTWDVRGAR